MRGKADSDDSFSGGSALQVNTIAILLGAFFFLIFIGVPIAYSVLLSAIITTFVMGVPLVIVFQNLVKGVNVYPLMAVPLFILMGELMTRGGITERLVVLSKALVGWIRGSLAMVNIVASLFFGAIQGSAAADTASIGAMMIPMMSKDGYDVDFSTCVTMSSSIEGMLIPPSHNFVLYALAAGNVSIGRLFIAGILPGVLLAIMLMIYCYFVSIKRQYPLGGKFHVVTAAKAFRDAAPGLAAVLIVVVGVVGGIFTATEASAIAVVYSILIGVFVYRKIKFRDLYEIFAHALKTIAIILILTGSSASFSWLVAYLQVPVFVSKFILGMTENPILILLLVNIFLIFCGMVMDMASLILITTPILLPIVMQIGVDPVHFGVIMILNLGIGLITPPVGGVLFIGSAISKLSVGQLTKSMMPFFLVMLCTLFLLTYIPEFSMFLPRLLLPTY